MFYEIRQGAHTVEGDLNTMLFNRMASTVPKMRTFRLLWWMQNLQQSTWEHGVLYADRSSKDEHLQIRPFC
jgi:hypothetical protein